MKTLNVVSLFCGCGGGDIGLHGGFYYNKKYYPKLKFKSIFALDIDKDALRTYQVNFPKTKVRLEDIKNVDAKDIPDCSIIIGGFPCQSFSSVNPTKNPFDERGNLYKEMVRIVSEKKPVAFIAENVKGLYTLHKGDIFKSVISAFNKAGYKAFSKLICAADYGIPQLRERIIIVGIRKDICKEDFAFPLPTTPLRNTPLKVCIDNLSIDEQKYYFSKRAVEGFRQAKNNMKRGLAQDLDKPCLTITAHLSKVSINSRDPVLLVNKENDIYRRFTPREAARIQSFPDSFNFPCSETKSYRQIGNAIPPVMFWHICKTLQEYLVRNNKISSLDTN